MAAHDEIEIRNLTGHGWYRTRAGAFDLMIMRYLPASVQDLRAKIRELNPDANVDDLQTVTECLMILAELRGHATN
ncbi:hypothetical protein ACH4YO_40660 [Streptomyces noursei]|uniref:hypothetical protein n=1 Tax=Streptomyces noursei TaxID=1971 RepID=UPI00081C96BC|nr:hypothetical protein SNOUR_00070 [Streptomyces noursei ATCC 11455]ANZ21998.1 hypothetical protein SNOUR_43880 [Streptomyces noursei ATCC 11455]MCZ0996420.1 hypothetical protein [Streptomyces noursei]